MSHDYTSVAAQIAGVGDNIQRPDITPEQLVTAFCAGRDAGYSGSTGSTGRDETINAAVSRGFCGYNGRRDTNDNLLTGVDDGYEFMGWLEEHGWFAMHEKGDWPYVVYLHQGLAVVEYCEADFTLWVFDTQAAKTKFVQKLRNA